MNIRNLINQLDNIDQNNLGIKKYISEGLYSTPEMQPHWKRIDENFFKGYDSYLAEVALTPDQIQNIFKQAGGVEAPTDPGKLAAIVDKVMPSSQAASLGSSLPEPNAGPVQGFEQKATAAVDALPGADGATKQSLIQWIKQGVTKPETQQLILAAVGAGVGGLLSKVGPIISMIPGGGPVASAITGAIIAGAVSVASAKLQGKDWKSAFKGAIKPALIGGASAVIGNLATTAISSMTGGSTPAQDTGQTGIGPQGGVSQGASSDPSAGVTDGGGKRGDSGWNSMKANTNPDGSPMTLDQINQAKADLRAGNESPGRSVPMQAQSDAAMKAGGINPYAQQAKEAAQGTQNDKDYWTNKNPNTRGLKESFAESAYVDKQATLRMWLDQEAKGLAVSRLALKTTVKEGIMDSLKGMFGGKKSASPAAGGVTLDALNKAWTEAGSPTDSEEVAKVLQSAGVPAETVTKVFADLKLPAPGASVDAPATTTPAEPKLPPTQQGQATPGAEPPVTPQVEKQSKIGVGQINKIVPTLRVRDLKSVQKNVDNSLAKRTQKQPTAEGNYVGFYSKFLGEEI